MNNKKENPEKVVVKWKKFFIYVLLFVSIVFTASLINFAKVITVDCPDNYGSLVHNDFYQERVDKVDDIEILRQIAVVSMNYAFKQGEIQLDMHGAIKKMLLEHCLMLFSLWGFLVIGYYLLKKGGQAA